ncbi:polyketide cyclase [Streptomyces sp. NRRL F-4489]|uniref:SRPBCC family protein n=1 Tax=Streptomyces sp. NRRL F-4489 TaxID=1609095 RepID=UPI000749855D|nr:SRPBCC family protein [Streptomyces sp. NRRL F-4489]KUL38878.1 polyketide cyclase [Streptomyces sp. NRRL F-4489]
MNSTDTTDSAGTPSRHLSVRIDRPVQEVYAYASNPANLPDWAHGLGESITKVGDQWVAESTLLGRVVVAFAPPNDLGVLDHDVTLPSGETVYNPVRVIADGSGSEVVFTLRRQPGTTDADFERDATMVAADLNQLKRRVESA